MTVSGNPAFERDRITFPGWTWRWYLKARKRATLMDDQGEIIPLFGKIVLLVWHYPVTLMLCERIGDGGLAKFFEYKPGRYLTQDCYKQLGKATVMQRPGHPED